MNRLSVHTYGQTNTLTAIDQSYVQQPRFGSQDAAIWGRGIERQLRQIVVNLIQCVIPTSYMYLENVVIPNLTYFI